MKTFTFKLEKNPTKKMISHLRRAIKTGIPHVRDDEMLCGSIGAMMTVISRAKFEAFAAIVNHKPQTLNELAGILGKDLGNVSKDVKSLEAIGLVELRKGDFGDSRQVKPVAKYDQIAFDFSEQVRRASG
jgi:predicted transcriptional regulator